MPCKILFSLREFSSKPTAEEIQTNLAFFKNYEEKSLTSVQEFFKLIACGKSFRTGLYEQCRTLSTRNFKEAYVVALDFDEEEKEPQEYVKMFSLIGITPNGYYYSFSQGIKSKNNYRLVWLFDEPLTEYETFTFLAALLDSSSADKSTSDVNRLWHGTNHSYVVTFDSFHKKKDFGGLISSFKIKNGISPNKVVTAIKDHIENWQDDFCGENEYYRVSTPVTWVDRLKTVCPLWDRWCNGDYLNYNARLLLWTNLKGLRQKSDNKCVIDVIMSYFNEETYRSHSCTREQILSLMKKNALKPYKCCCEGTMTVVEYFKSGGKAANSTNKVDLSVLEKEMEKIKDILESDNNSYIICQAGAGKTKKFREWLNITKNTKVIYSAPSYTLLEQTAAKLKEEYNINLIIPPKKALNEPSDELIMMMGGQVKTYDKKRLEIINNIKSPDKVGFYGVSHQLLIRLNGLKDSGIEKIIIDENIETAIEDRVYLSLEDFQKIKPYCSYWTDKICSYYNLPHLSSINCIEIQKIINSFDVKAYAETNSYVIPKLCLLKNGEWKCCKYKNKLIFAKKNSVFDFGIPVKILTATPLTYYSNFILNNQKWEEINMPIAKNKGSISQWLGVTGAKGTRDYSKIEVLIEKAKTLYAPEKRKDVYVISFKDDVEAWEEAGFQVGEIIEENGEITKVHLANCAGLDNFKGKTVIVAGKFDLPHDWYTLFYKFWINPATMEEPTRSLQYFKANGQAVKIFLYDDEDLKKVQVERISYYLDQAAGRARALREEGAQVHIFANIPVASVDYFYYA